MSRRGKDKVPIVKGREMKMSQNEMWTLINEAKF